MAEQAIIAKKIADQKAKKKRDIWSERETNCLIMIWGKYMGQLRKFRRNFQVYVRMRGALIREHRIARNVLEIRNKVMNLTTLYKKEKIKIKNGEGPSEWRFWDQIHEILENSPTEEPPEDPMDNLQLEIHENFAEIAAMHIGDDNSSTFTTNVTAEPKSPPAGVQGMAKNPENYLLMCVQQISEGQVRLQRSLDNFQQEYRSTNTKVLELLEKQILLQQENREAQKKMYTLMEQYMTKNC